MWPHAALSHTVAYFSSCFVSTDSWMPEVSAVACQLVVDRNLNPDRLWQPLPRACWCYTHLPSHTYIHIFNNIDLLRQQEICEIDHFILQLGCLTFSKNMYLALLANKLWEMWAQFLYLPQVSSSSLYLFRPNIFFTLNCFDIIFQSGKIL